jgi:predicted GIY-YIG superfamily endonuclease
MSELFNFFQLVRNQQIPLAQSLDQIQRSNGVYMLFDSGGEFIYVGKADNLYDRIQEHCSAQEANPYIKGRVAYYLCEPTNNISEAEAFEGQLYDAYVTRTGKAPLANQNKPPGSQLDDQEVTKARTNILVELIATLQKAKAAR